VNSNKATLGEMTVIREDNEKKPNLLQRLVDWEQSPVLSGIGFVKDYVTSLPSRVFDWKVDRQLRALNSPDPKKRWKAVETLGKLKHPVSIWVILELSESLANDKDEIVRAKAAEALGILGGQMDSFQISRVLHRALSDDDEVVRVCASEALESIIIKEKGSKARKFKEQIEDEAKRNAATLKTVEDAISQAEAKMRLVDFQVQRRKGKYQTEKASIRRELLAKRKIQS